MWSFKKFLVQLLFGMDFHRSCQWSTKTMDSFYSCALFSRLSKVQRRLVQFSRAKPTVSALALWSDEARHLPIPRPASRTSMDPYVNILGSFLFPFKRSQHKGHRQILSASPTISLFLVLDFWYDIPPPHPRTLRRTYSYLPDCANLFE
jgi:hypothetical protein